MFQEERGKDRPLAQVLGSVSYRRSNRLPSLQYLQDTHRSLSERCEQSWTSPRAHSRVNFLDHIMRRITGSEEQILPQTFLEDLAHVVRVPRNVVIQYAKMFVFCFKRATCRLACNTRVE